MTNKPILKLSAIAAALAGGVAWGAEEDDAVKQMTKPESAVSAGIGYWTHDRPRLGTYDGMREKGPYGLLDALIVTRDEAGQWFRLDARNLGLDTREFRADWEKQGDFGVFMEYSRTPRDEPYSVFTGVTGIGTQTLRVPTPSVTPGGAIQLGTVREAFGAGFTKNLGTAWDFRLSAKTEDKTGARLWGRGGAAEFAAEPIDSNIRQMEAVLSYTKQALQVQGGYYGSWYTNRNSMVDTALTDGTNPFFLSLPLDNTAHQLYVNGGYQFTKDTRGTFKVSYQRVEQNEQIPVGPGVAVSPTAPGSLNGRLDNTLVQLGINQRATKDFTWLASLRSYDSDEKTPQFRVVQPAAGCAGTPGSCVDTTPLQIKTLTGKVEGTYRTQQNLSLTGGLDLSKVERNVPVGDPNAAGFDNQRWVPFRTTVDETTLRLEARRSMTEAVNGRVVYAHSKRDGSDYSRTNQPQSDMINPIYLADRDRDKVKFVLDWAVSQPLNVTFNVEYAKDKYGQSDARPYGLNDGSAALFSVDASYAIAEAWQLNAYYTRDQTKAKQTGQRDGTGNPGAAVKEANLEDLGDTFGLGVKWLGTAKWKAGADLLYQKNVNKYPESVTLVGGGSVYPTGTTGPLPDIANTLTRLKLNATYAMQKRSELRLEYTHELWKTNDWSWMFADGTPFTYGTATDGTQVTQAPRQSADWFGVRYIYRFQ